MRRHLLFGLLMIAIVGSVVAQQGFVSQSVTLSWQVFDQNGKSFTNPSPDVDGSPFLKDEWKLGSLIMYNNYKFDSIKIRLNLFSQEVHVMDKEGNEIALARGFIKKILWTGAIAGLPGGRPWQSGFPEIDAQGSTNFYEVLSQGRLWLLRSDRKIIATDKDAVSGEVKKAYQIYEDYYVYDGKAMERVKKDKGFMTTLLIDQREKIEVFLAANNLKFKSIDDVKKTIDYYNTL